MPVEGDLTANTVLVTAKEGLRVQSPGGNWKPADGHDVQGVGPRGLQWTAAERTADVTLGVYREEYGETGSTLAHGAWVQTWMTGPMRQDRAVFRVTTERPTVELALPPGVDPRDVRLWLDGKPATAQATAQGRLIVALGGDRVSSSEGRVSSSEGRAPAEGPSRGPRRVEVIYQFQGPRPSPGSMQLDLPRLEPGVFVHRTYWELILPRDEHLLASPAGLTAEYHWDWTGLGWARKPVLEQAHLETWSGARRLADFAPETNRYLFSALEMPDRCELRTASRSMLVLWASGALLAAGLLVIYLPAARHPVVLLAAAIALGSAAMVYPEPTLVLSQAASVGLVLVVLAGWLRRITARRARSPLFRPSVSSIVERTSTLPLMPEGKAEVMNDEG